MTVTVLFDGSFEGFLTIIHDHYYQKIRPDFIEVEDCYQQRLDTNYYLTQTDPKKAEIVSAAIVDKISNDSANLLYTAFLSHNPERFINMYRYTVLGFKYGKAVEKRLHEEAVVNTINIYKNVSREAMRINEFLRFSETETGVFYADISPDNNVLEHVADFFTARFGNMPFMIHDVKRGIVALYDTKSCIFREVPEDINIILSKNEADYQKLWTDYHKSISNPSRINKKLQRLMLPMKYRKHMTEFKYTGNIKKIDLIPDSFE